jgi:hypothetical protein
MMAGNWQLDCGPDGSVLFGPQSTPYPFSVAPEIGDPNRETQDQGLPGVDGALFGVDTTAGQTIAFGLTAVGETDAEADALYALFRKVWRADTIRRTAGATATLTAPSGRSTFGRPRRITPTLYPDDAAVVGITADFTTQDDLWYGQEESLRVPIGLSQGGGFAFNQTTPLEGPEEIAPDVGLFTTTGLSEVEPGSYRFTTDGLEEYPVSSGLYGTDRAVRTRGLRFPLVARGYTSRVNTFVVGGDLPAWPIITIYGQILNPVVTLDNGFRIAAATSLKYDETLTIDTRPGRRSVLRNGTQIAALTRTSDLLEDAALTPGAHTLTLSGSSSTGSPSAVVTWRSTYSTP